jgi:hypothetical protein
VARGEVVSGRYAIEVRDAPRTIPAAQATLQQIEGDAATAVAAELDQTTLADVLARTPRRPHA